ncbi:MAG TPA: Pycsar system effector family protein [Chitinophagaceae bacterium]|nr:Pycsar system effector family protein [Chitinophagaceae bacterium]
MDYKNLLLQVETFARSFFTSHPDKRFVYHNLQHTEGVVKAAAEIANHFQLDEKEYCIVVSAAWFHDLGYFVLPGNHEAEGAALARTFFENAGTDSALSDAVCACILATRLPQRPETLLEKILCDADLFHLGTADFPEVNKRMRKEAELVKGKAISGKKWRKETIVFLETQHYWTDYCRLLLNDEKNLHLQRLKDSLVREKKSPKEASVSEKNEMASETKAAKKRPDRGIETMFRLTSANNQRLSDMADNKAHILITVNAIILSAIISLLLRKLDSNPSLIIPTYLILTVSLLTIIFSILATRPSISKGVFTDQDIKEKKVNLLFFGNFYRMSLEAYTNGMLQVMEDRDFLYGSLIKDVYGQGVAVGRKYRLLRISYSIFMYGLIISVIAFIIATFLTS